MKKMLWTTFLIMLVFSCNTASKVQENQSENDISEINFVETKINERMYEESDNTFQHFQVFDLNATLTEDFNGDSVQEQVQFRTIDGEKVIVIVDGKSGKSTIIDGKIHEVLDGLEWVDYWGIVRDTTTSEVLFKDGEVFKDSTIHLTNPSIALMAKEIGGGLIIYQNKKYRWVHQTC